MIPIYTPYLKKYKQSAIKAINDEWISNYGEFVKKAEDKMKEILRIKYCILMNNGTSATHCLFLALKYKYPYINKIYIPNNVFIAPWNCALMEYNENQLEVMKMNSQTLNIDTSEEYIKSLDNNSCILIVHNLGNIINVPRLKRIRPDLIFIEDNCEGFFGKYEDHYSGTESLCSSVSFYANKSITTGEGGAFLTNDEDVYNYIKKIYSHGMTNERYIHDKVAYNYRMTNIEAGFLYDQLMDLETILRLKANVFDTYDEFLKDEISEKKIIKTEFEESTIKANWMYCIIIPGIEYAMIEKFMNKNNVEVRPFFYDINKHVHLSNIINKNKEILVINNGVMLPSYPELTNKEQKYIADILKQLINQVES